MVPNQKLATGSLRSSSIFLNFSDIVNMSQVDDAHMLQQNNETFS